MPCPVPLWGRPQLLLEKASILSKVKYCLLYHRVNRRLREDRGNWLQSNGHQRWFEARCRYQAYTRQSLSCAHPCTCTNCCRILAWEWLGCKSRICTLVCLAWTWTSSLAADKWGQLSKVQEGRKWKRQRETPWKRWEIWLEKRKRH